MTQDHKYCGECRNLLYVGNFKRNPKTADGLYPFCDACIVEKPHLMKAECAICRKTRSLTKFQRMDRTAPCSYCSANFGGVAVSILQSAELFETGHNTVKDLFATLGYPSASKGELNAGARWLRSHGFTEKRINGRKGFTVSAKPGDNTFSDWARRYNAVDALGLPDAYREQLMSGAVVPRHVRLAMSALMAGLPPYAAPGDKP